LATVIRPRLDSRAGAVLSQALFPSYTEIDPYQMAAYSIDAAIRNVVAAGADLNRVALLDNFCWCDSTNPERLWELKEAARACYDTAVAFGTPFISGKDSMFNDFRGFDGNGEPVSISIQPTLLISSIGLIDDVAKSVSLDFKRPGDLIYLLGETSGRLAGSEYLAMLGVSSGGERLPALDPTANRAVYAVINKLTNARLLASSQSVGRGGLGAAIALAAVGGMMGAVLSLPSGLSGEQAMFSESPGRVLVSVNPEHRSRFEATVASIPCALIGEVGGSDLLTIDVNGDRLVEAPIGALYDRYHATFAEY
jgi:phosphoribosylformylglycinamidine (FGAM) synthase-like enzyme